MPIDITVNVVEGDKKEKSLQTMDNLKHSSVAENLTINDITPVLINVTARGPLFNKVDARYFQASYPN